MTAALDKWTDKFSDLPLFNDKSHNKTGLADDGLEKFKLDTAYYVTIARAQIIKSEYNGDVQLEVDYSADGFRAKKVWYALPMQESDLNREPDMVTWLTQRRMREIELIHAAAMPSVYALYDVVHTRGPDKVYIGIDGKEMDKDAFAMRRKAIEHNLTESVKLLHNSIGKPVRSIEGTKLYIVMAKNEKKPKYPYVNLFRTPPLFAPLYKAAQYADVDTGAHNESVPF